MADFDIPSRVVPATYRLVPHYNIDSENSDDAPFKSALGTPVYSCLEFVKDNNGTSLDNSLGVGEQITSETLLRIDTVLITVTGTKNIIKTPIVGRRGTVKEYISQGDYQINFRGSILPDQSISSQANVFPRDKVNLFIELLTLSKPLKVACDFLGLFGIDFIIVDPDFTIHEKEGSRNEVPFEFNAISDFPDDFELSLSS